MGTRNVLIVHHSPTEKLQAIADVVIGAAREAVDFLDGEGTPTSLSIRHALEPDVHELLAADAVIFGTSANFGYISGALKHYFDSTFVSYTEAQERGEVSKNLPVSWWIRGGYDTTGAAKAMEAITSGMNVQVAARPVEFTGDLAGHEEDLATMAQSVVGAVVASQ